MARTTLIFFAFAAGMTALSSSSALSQTARATEVIAPDKGRITGTMTIDYNSRSERGASGIDVYEIKQLDIADLMRLRGIVQREPEKKMTYAVKIDVINPKNPAQVAADVAILRGDLTIDANGRYIPDTGRLRLDIVKGQQSTNKFGGAIQGRDIVRWWEIGDRLKTASAAASKLYSRTVGGKIVTIEVKNPDPLSFERTTLAAGPFTYLTETTVSGNLDYDYELGNWLTDQNGISMTYTIGDKSITDRITGSIRFIEAEGTFNDAAGKPKTYTGYYEYSLRVNEEKISNDQQFFDGENSSAELDSFFGSEDQTKPGLYGRVYYMDTEDGCKRVADDNGQMQCVGPTRSEVTYDLKAVGMTYQQTANWFKLEQLVLGPFTDE